MLVIQGYLSVGVELQVDTVAPEDVVVAMDDWWSDYEVSFPENERFSRDRMIQFILGCNKECKTRVQFATLNGVIVGVQMSKIFPDNGFDFALEIWTKKSFRGKGIARQIYERGVHIDRELGLRLYAEVNPDRSLIFFHKLGLRELPIIYHQPPVGKYKPWVRLRFMMDINLTGGGMVGRRVLENDIGLVYEYLYGVPRENVQLMCKFGIDGDVS